MDPLWLTFTSASLEERYRRKMTYSQPYPIDVWYWWWATTIRVAAVSKFGGWLGLLSCWPGLLYLVWMEVELFIRWSVDAQRRRRWRTNLVIASRLLHCLEIGTGSVNFVSAFLTFGNDQIPNHPLLVGLSFCMVHGVITMVFLGLFLPLSFRVHLPLQLGMSIALLSVLGPEVCRQTGGGTLHGMNWLFKALDTLALQEAHILFGTLMGMEISWTVDFPCLHVAMFAHVYIGFGVVSYMVWLFERQSRLAFIEALPIEERHIAPVKPLHCLNFFAHFVVSFVAFGILWIGFSVIAPNMMW
eukprot:evm.model.scf_12EXC.19 EVM.evm.TU.scf_12EXC.19   scf_12EXC:205075-206726(-)